MCPPPDAPAPSEPTDAAAPAEATDSAPTADRRRPSRTSMRCPSCPSRLPWPSVSPRHGVGGADGRSLSASASRSSWASWSPSASAPPACTPGASSTKAGSCPASTSATRTSAGSPASRPSAAIANAYASLGSGQITLTGPDGETTTISYSRRRPRSRHRGAARRGIRGRPPGRSAREPHRRTPGCRPRRDPRLRRHLRPRQAGGGRRSPRHDDRPDPGGCLTRRPVRTGRSASPRRRTVELWTRRPW